MVHVPNGKAYSHEKLYHSSISIIKGVGGDKVQRGVQGVKV